MKLSLTIEELAAMTSIGETQLRTWAKNDPTFPVFRVGKKLIVPSKDMEKWLSLKAQAREGMAPTSPIVARIRKSRMHAAGKKSQKKEGIAWLG